MNPDPVIKVLSYLYGGYFFAMDTSEIAKILTDKGADKPCHRCGKEDFAIIDQYTYIPLQEDLPQRIKLGGSAIPAVITVCVNCGAVNFHALAGLGLMPEHNQQGDHSSHE